MAEKKNTTFKKNEYFCRIIFSGTALCSRNVRKTAANASDRNWGWRNLNYYQEKLCDNGNVWKIFAKMGVFRRFS
jgi:hypothetical protein